MCSDMVTNDIAYKDGQYFDCGKQLHYSPWMTQDTTPKIVGALLALICRLRMWACRLLLCPQRGPLCWFWVNTVAQPLNHTRWNTRNWWRSVDALLTLCSGSIDAHCQVKRHPHSGFCLSRQPILGLWINAIAQPLDDAWCNTQHHWRSIDAYFQTGVVTMLPTLLPAKVANTLILVQCRLAPPVNQTRCNTQDCWCSVDPLLMLYWCAVDALLTLCWRSLSGEATWTLTVLPIMAANTSIMDNSGTTSLGWHKVQHPKSLMLCWRSLSYWGCDHVAFSFAHKGCQFVDNEEMP
jgi:hypothetical protein